MTGFALIVEDDPVLQRVMAVQLARMSFEVRGALHYDAAVHLLTTVKTPSLVCVDLELPTRSGYELCEYIRGPLGLARIPILVTSESAFPEDLACAEEAGANAFLKKPFSVRELASSIESLLDRLSSSRPSSMDVRP